MATFITKLSVDYGDDDPELNVEITIHQSHIQSIISLSLHRTNFDLVKWTQFCNDIKNNKVSELEFTTLNGYHGFKFFDNKLTYIAEKYGSNDPINVKIVLLNDRKIYDMLTHISLRYNEHCARQGDTSHNSTIHIETKTF